MAVLLAACTASSPLGKKAFRMVGLLILPQYAGLYLLRGTSLIQLTRVSCSRRVPIEKSSYFSRVCDAPLLSTTFWLASAIVVCIA